jgi:hypothetical protein
VALYEKAKRLKDGSYLVQARRHLNKSLELNTGYQDNELNKEIEGKLKETETAK